MNIFRKFFRDSSGSYIPLFGFLVVPLVGLIGAAIDYSRAARVKTEMQSALDQTVLALSREIGVTATPAKLNTRANELFKALSPVQAHDLLADITLTASNTDNTISLTATSRVKAEFMAVVGIKEIPVGGESVATWGSRKIDIALALDNTGSMAGTKLSELKKAAQLLVDTFVPTNNTTPDTVRIGLVPFTTMVRMPTSVRAGAYFTTYQETFSKKGSKTGATVLATAPGSGWTGCVVDRNQSYDVAMAAPASFDTKFPGVDPNQSYYSTLTENCTGLQEVQPLTSTLSVLKTAINNMKASGNTNVAIGVAWGMQALSGLQPLPEARDPKTIKDLSQILIVLTDGDNTESRFSSTQSAIDARTTLACTNAKAAGYRVYTIRLLAGNETVLRNCATSPAMYYSVKTASELTTVFANIAREIADLRLAK